MRTQSAILFTFAVEEFGKAVLLQRALTSSAETAALVSIEGFYDHTAKLEAAASELPEASLRSADLKSTDVLRQPASGASGFKPCLSTGSRKTMAWKAVGSGVSM